MPPNPEQVDRGVDWLRCCAFEQLYSISCVRMLAGRQPLVLLLGVKGGPIAPRPLFPLFPSHPSFLCDYPPRAIERGWALAWAGTKPWIMARAGAWSVFAWGATSGPRRLLFTQPLRT